MVVGGVAGEGTASAAAPTTLFSQASASGFPVGINIFDTVNLSGGVFPGGVLTFTLFGPGNTTCAGSPIFASRTTVQGNGNYQSNRYTTKLAGTYRWVANYGGDLFNGASSSDCADPKVQVTVARRMTLLNASAGWAAPSTTETALLTNGAGPNGPTGSMTFKLYGPADSTCARAPVYTTTRSVAGNGTYRTAPFNVTAGGTYQWVAMYGGDANNLAAGSGCAESASRFTVTGVSGSPSTVARGGTVTASWAGVVSPTSNDWIGLYRTGTADGGAVVAWNYTDGTDSGSVSLKFPWSTTAGTFELRLMANNTTTPRLATSAPITMAW